MRLLGFEFTRVARDPRGHPLHHWHDVVTLDQLSPESRQLITKMARVAARDFYDQAMENLRDQLAQLSPPEPAPAPPYQPEGECVLCHAPFTPDVTWTPAGHGWVHYKAGDCHTTAGRGVCEAPRGEPCRFNQMGDGACVYDTDCFPNQRTESGS